MSGMETVDWISFLTSQKSSWFFNIIHFWWIFVWTFSTTEKINFKVLFFSRSFLFKTYSSASETLFSNLFRIETWSDSKNYKPKKKSTWIKWNFKLNETLLHFRINCDNFFLINFVELQQLLNNCFYHWQHHGSWRCIRYPQWKKCCNEHKT